MLENSNKDIVKCLMSDHPSLIFLEKFKSGKFDEILKEFKESDTIPAGPIQYHTSSVLGHILRCMDEAAGDPLAVWMALCHDCGKLLTQKDMLPHHYQHEERGKILAVILAERCCLPQKYIEAGSLTASLHMRASHYDQLRNGKKYDLLMTIDNAGLSIPFWKVVSADCKNNIGITALADLSFIHHFVTMIKDSSNDIKSFVCEEMKKHYKNKEVL